MKQKLLLIIPLALLVTLILAACEVPRPQPEGADIDIPPPQVEEEAPPAPATEEAPPTAPTEEAPTEPATPLPPDARPPDITQEGVPAPAPPDADAVEPNTVLVKLSMQASIQARSAELGSDNVIVAGIDSLDQRLREIGASQLEPILEEVAQTPGINQDLESLSAQAEEVSQLYSVNFSPDRTPQEVVDLLGQDASVEYVEPNFIAGIAGEPHAAPNPLDPNDPYFRFQWHFQTIQAPAAWDVTTGEGVTVAVVDTGVDFRAPDLANTRRQTGYDFVNNDDDPTDDQSHGTHVAGTIAQSTNNNLGVSGVAFNAEILPVKVLGANGNGSYENIIKGIVYAVNQGAKVINLSLAGRNGSQGLRDAVQYAANRGVLVVAAAGNSNSAVAYPAAYDEFVLAVGATRFDNTRARYSNFGPEIDLVAPGGDVGVDQNQDGYADGVLQQSFKEVGGDFTYLFFEGTSMAAPHVAGAAALLAAQRPNASPEELESLLAQSARNLGPPEEYGAGLIQVADALALASPTPVEPTEEPTEEPSDTPTPSPMPPTLTPTATPTPLPPTFTPTSPPGSEHGEDIPTDTPTPTPTPSPSTPVQMTPTPTPPPGVTETPTPTSPPLPAGELLVNGGFETDEGWVFGDTPIRGEYSTDVTLSGDRAAKLGLTGDRDGFSFTSVWQRVDIPAEASQVTLTANLYPVTQDQSGDSQNILILNRNFRVIETLSRELSDSQSWETRTYDLSHLSGQTIYVYFGVVNRGRTGEPTALYVDDVSLSWAR